MIHSISGLEQLSRVLQSAAAATGSGLNLELNGRYASAALQMTGTFVGTITFEATVDGTNFISILGADITTGTSAVTSTTANAVLINVKGIRLLRARISAYTSGTITVTATAVPA